jgi:hypothetical protein
VGIFKTLFQNTAVNYKASEIIAAYLQNIFAMGILKKSPQLLGSDFVSLAWKENSVLLKSKPNVLPTPIILAAFSIANGLKLYDRSDMQRAAIGTALGNILGEIQTTMRKEQLNAVDETVLVDTLAIFAMLSREFDNL